LRGPAAAGSAVLEPAYSGFFALWAQARSSERIGRQRQAFEIRKHQAKSSAIALSQNPVIPVSVEVASARKNAVNT